MARHVTRKTVLAASLAIALAAAGGGVAVAAGGDDDSAELPISGADLARASEAALAETGGGRVTDTEIEDEESYYEVEVTLDDGREVDVQLDRQFEVVGTEAEDDEEADD